MVRGIESFKEWFKGCEEQYAIIGGTACDLLMTNEGLSFRATKDIDLVLIIEAVNTSFGRQFWDYITAAGYEHRAKSSGNPQFYRFTKPKSEEFPFMIELFSRKPDSITLPENATLSPLPLDEEISSLSAILLDNDYYELLRKGRVLISGITVLGAPYLIPFKAKAWLDLTKRKATGEQIDSKNIRKHKNDVYRLTELLNLSAEPLLNIPDSVKNDMKDFIDCMRTEDVDLNQLGIPNTSKEYLLESLRTLYQ